jgi:hypothetical protein
MTTRLTRKLYWSASKTRLLARTRLPIRHHHLIHRRLIRHHHRPRRHHHHRHLAMMTMTMMTTTMADKGKKLYVKAESTFGYARNTVLVT